VHGVWGFILLSIMKEAMINFVHAVFYAENSVMLSHQRKNNNIHGKTQI
jgi:hypothetical protein